MREPVLTVEPGEVFTLEVEDAFNHMFTEASQLPTRDTLGPRFRSNPASGPIFIEGAKQGDTLIVHIHDIRVDEKGVALILEGEGPLADSKRYPDCGEAYTEIIQHIPGPSGTTSDGMAILDGRISWELSPHIGVLATAPEDPIRSKVDTQSMSGSHGGNLDCREFRRGNNVMLNVAVEGAYLYVGDVHASQASEFGLTADESRAEVDLSCEVLSNKTIPDVRVETENSLIQLSCGPCLNEAVMKAHLLLLDWLTIDYGLLPRNVYLQFGVNPDVKIEIYRFSAPGQYDHTVGVTFPKRQLVC